MKIRKAIPADESRVINLLNQLGSKVGAQAFRQIVQNPALGSILIAEENGEAPVVITISFPTAFRYCGFTLASKNLLFPKKPGERESEANLSRRLLRGLFKWIL